MQFRTRCGHRHPNGRHERAGRPATVRAAGRAQRHRVRQDHLASLLELGQCHEPALRPVPRPQCTKKKSKELRYSKHANDLLDLLQVASGDGARPAGPLLQHVLYPLRLVPQLPNPLANRSHRVLHQFVSCAMRSVLCEATRVWRTAWPRCGCVVPRGAAPERS